MILTLGRRSVHRRRHAYIAREGTPRSPLVGGA
jgi:hypothetical protein